MKDWPAPLSANHGKISLSSFVHGFLKGRQPSLIRKCDSDREKEGDRIHECATVSDPPISVAEKDSRF
jgi:hypothetical protein